MNKLLLKVLWFGPVCVLSHCAAINGLHLAKLVERESPGSTRPGFFTGPCGLHLIPDKPCIGWGWDCVAITSHCNRIVFFFLHSWLLVKKPRFLHTWE